MMDRQKISKDVYDLAQSQEPIAPLVKEALAVIEQSLESHGPERVSLSFNGGKDCTVLLHLYAAALARRYPQKTGLIAAIYIPVPSPFPDLEEFIAESSKAYELDLFTCATSSEVPLPVESVTPGTATPTTPKQSDSYVGSRILTQPVGKARGGEGMRRALELYKTCFPHIQAILIGTRRTDPHGASLTHRNMTDPGWPSFERINPIINWSYSDVWIFLRKLNVPYCRLYDQGYTSLGSTYNTHPNPALLVRSPSMEREMFPTSVTVVADNPNATCISEIPCTSPLPNETKGGGSCNVVSVDPGRYRPAYELEDGNLERAGRVSGATVRALA
ncbi:hypothetical protein F5I97DRAFT_1900618 [Phlebopus sp. FC_14]|nr:hypothetical protein F5I97DRAFT_1900618 [Phlebopus sp. FC_14]